MKKNFLTVMTCAAIFSIFFTCGAFAETAQPPETSKPPSGNIDSKLVGTWVWKNYKTSTNYTTYTYMFHDDGKFILYINGGTASNFDYVLTADYEVSDGWIFFKNIICKSGGGVIQQDYQETQRAEYKFEAVDGYEDYLIMPLMTYQRDGIPLSFSWTRWTKQ